MMKKEKKTKQNLSKLGCVALISLMFTGTAYASNITDANGNAINKHPGTGAYEITPEAIINGMGGKDIGFRKFQDLHLDKGDVMNFLFQWYRLTGGDPGLDEQGDISTFVNLIQNQAQINGIVNALTKINGDIKSDGNLVFISPNGFVVGASGVLNVGNLSVLTPDANNASFKNLWDGIKTGGAGLSQANITYAETNPNLSFNAADFAGGQGVITVNGGVLARGNVELDGSTITVGKKDGQGYGTILAGVNDNTKFGGGANAASNNWDTAKGQADALFNALVNTDTIMNANTLAGSNGEIKIISSQGVDIKADGTVGNVSGYNGKTTITNNGADGVKVAGRLLNANGNMTIDNNNGAVNVSGLAQNKGTMDIDNSGTGILVASSGQVINDGTMNITNHGSNGFTVDGEVTNDTGVATLTNNAGKFSVAGTVTSKGTALNMTNNGADGLEVTGLVDNVNGAATIINTNGLLNVKNGGRVRNTGRSLKMLNSTGSGFTVAGEVDNEAGTVNLENQTGTFLVSGTVLNKGTSLTMLNSGNGGMDITGIGFVHNENGPATITNTNGLLYVENGGKVLNNGASLKMLNSTGTGFTVAGEVDNEAGTVNLENQTGTFLVSGTVLNKGTSLTMLNSGNGGMDITGIGFVHNENGPATITNTNGLLYVENGGHVLNKGNSLTMTNSGTGMKIAGTVENQRGSVLLDNQNGILNVTSTGRVLGNRSSNSMEIKNTGSELLIDDGGIVENINTLTMSNTGANGLNINGAVTNQGNTTITNSKTGTAGLNIGTTGRVTNKGNKIDTYNYASGGTNVRGKITTTDSGKVNITNSDSNTTIGDNSSNDFYIDADGNVTITNTNGNVLNGNTTLLNNKGKTLIRTTKDSNASLTITANNGAIGEEVGPCDGGICTGVGPSERDLTKSINTNIDGVITATSTKGTKKSLINMASLDNDMHVDKIHADGRVILLADNADLAKKGTVPYSVVNRSKDRTGATPNIKGSGISIIASGDIGESGKALTFIQTGAKVDVAHEDDDANQPHDLIMDSNGNLAPIHTGDGVEMLAIGDINAKGLDDADGTKNDTNICTIASRTGTVNLELSGNSYIRDITAQDEVNVVNRGTELYIENLGGAPSRYAKTGDYYGGYEGIVPEKANLKVLDLGTIANPNKVPNSTLVVKNGTINGRGSTSHPAMDQDVTVTADNAYIGGYYFNMGKHRMPGLTSVTKDDRTNTLTPIGDKPVSIRGRAVRPEDVTAIGRDPEERIYYYGKEDGDPDDASGSGQRDDPTFNKEDEDGDDLVVPEPTKDTTPTKPTVPTTPPGDDDDDDKPTQPTTPDVMEEARKNIRQRVVEENFDAIDKRQYMRFDIDNSDNSVVFQSSPEVESVVNISRGGVSLAHNKKLKVGDVVPVHLKYGDIEIDADVKIVSATDKRAGAEFINLDEATQTKLLYLSLIEEGKTIKMDPNVTAQNGYGIKNVSFQQEEANSLGD